MSDCNSICIHVVHANRLERAGLVGSLGAFSDFLVSEEGLDRASARCESADEPVVITDLDGAMKIARRVTASRNGFRRSPQIVVVSGPDRERELKQALECRVQGYLVNGFTLDQLADSVRAVHRGARYLCPRAAARLADSNSFSPLTGREEEVLELVAQGLCNKSIARQLGIALGTVKSHLKSAYAKLFVDSRTQAVVVSERRGLLARHGGVRHAMRLS